MAKWCDLEARSNLRPSQSSVGTEHPPAIERGQGVEHVHGLVEDRVVGLGIVEEPAEIGAVRAETKVHNGAQAAESGAALGTVDVEGERPPVV